MHAIVLCRRDFRENDQIISFYTKEKGKLELLARGVKKITSKNSAHLEPFSAVQIDCTPGKEIDYLTKVQPSEYYSRIRKSLKKSLYAKYAVAIVDKIIDKDNREESIYTLLEQYLWFLNYCDQPKAVLLDSFVTSLLSILGFAPELNNCVSCGRQEQLNGFNIAGGGAVCIKCTVEEKKNDNDIMECSYEIMEYLNVFAAGNFQAVHEMELESSGQEMLHAILHKYIIFHTERHICDWNKMYI